MGSDLGLSSPYVLPGRAPIPYCLSDEPDPDERWNGDEHLDADGGDPGGFDWSDAHRWRPPRPGEPVDSPPAWLGVTPTGPAPVAEAGRGDPAPVQVFRLGAVLPGGEVVAVVLRAASADVEWLRAVWDGSPEDIEAVLGAAMELIPTWLDERSAWGLVPGVITVRAVAAGMVVLAGWEGVTSGVRAVLAEGKLSAP